MKGKEKEKPGKAPVAAVRIFVMNIAVIVLMLLHMFTFS